MTRHDGEGSGGSGVPHARRSGHRDRRDHLPHHVPHHVLLSAVLAVIVGLSAAIYVGVDAGDGGRRGQDTLASSRTGPHSAAAASTGVWVGSWAAAPVGSEPLTEPDGTAGRTVRNIVHTSVGGTSARITLSNLYGTGALTVTSVTLAVAADDDSPAADPGTLRRLTFGGRPAISIPAGEQAMSDAVPLAVPGDTDVLVSLYTPTSAGPVTFHHRAQQTSYVADGEHTADVTGTPYTAQSTSWRYLTALDVLSEEADGTVVAFGDSITDGSTSTPGANRRWPDALADRLRAARDDRDDDAPRYGVVNAGISGNRVLTGGGGRPANNPSGLDRFDRDVLDRPQVKVVVIDLGVNDILRSRDTADPDAVLDGLRDLVRRAHAHGIKAVGTTLLPFRGHRGYTDAREDVRRRINAEIRSGSVYDTVVDVDRAMHDPYDPRRLKSEYDSGDHLHPSDRGYRKMAQLIKWSQLRGADRAQL
ncbi:SGNH/GDSL hydrolase family protein [Streptomyces sp. ID05-47C]|uniref:SGNH/GDSL hydrolase family protein n=1 Tax=Streptomyces sp. ID05-47C TaxID=3028665 RepID=UPI0029BEE85E|nr:SGNH/GDSL hydrolase family protein [Streptomyces sp. ID05-47C]MDX3575083.1 SGNH/GDSL hydrolase family protein [Streptomyces sp. ID05-47C]